MGGGPFARPVTFASTRCIWVDNMPRPMRRASAVLMTGAVTGEQPHCTRKIKNDLRTRTIRLVFSFWVDQLWV